MVKPGKLERDGRSLVLIWGLFWTMALTVLVQVAAVCAQVEVFKEPGQGGPRRLIVHKVAATFYHQPALGARVTDRLKRGHVLRNLGCSDDGQHVWCHVQIPLGKGGEKAFTLQANLRPAAGPDGIVPFGVDDSGARARQRDFNTTAHVPCRQAYGATLGQCSLGIARGTGGDATVVARFSNGFARRLFIENGVFTHADATMAGVGRDVSTEVLGEIFRLQVDGQTYDIPRSFLPELRR